MTCQLNYEWMYFTFLDVLKSTRSLFADPIRKYVQLFVEAHSISSRISPTLLSTWNLRILMRYPCKIYSFDFSSLSLMSFLIFTRFDMIDNHMLRKLEIFRYFHEISNNDGICIWISDVSFFVSSLKSCCAPNIKLRMQMISHVFFLCKSILSIDKDLS